MTLMDIVSDPHLCTQMLDLMRKRGVLDEHDLISIDDIYDRNFMATHELLNKTTLHLMSDATLARDHGLTRLQEDHGLASPWLAQHIAATRR